MNQIKRIFDAEQEMLDSREKEIKVEKDAYYLRMKEKLRIKKVESIRKVDKKVSLQFSPQLNRKQTQWAIQEPDIEFTYARKWSGTFSNDEITN